MALSVADPMNNTRFRINVLVAALIVVGCWFAISRPNRISISPRLELPGHRGDYISAKYALRKQLIIALASEYQPYKNEHGVTQEKFDRTLQLRADWQLARMSGRDGVEQERAIQMILGQVDYDGLVRFENELPRRRLADELVSELGRAGSLSEDQSKAIGDLARAIDPSNRAFANAAAAGKMMSAEEFRAVEIAMRADYAELLSKCEGIVGPRLSGVIRDWVDTRVISRIDFLRLSLQIAESRRSDVRGHSKPAR